MTVSTLIVRNTYDGNGVTTIFAYTFRVVQQSDLVVSTVVEVTGVETVLVLGVGYTVTGIGAASGGNVTLLAGAPPDGTMVVLRRVVSYDQPTDYANQGAFNAERHERSYDRATMQIQQLADAVSRSVQQPPSGLPWYDAQGNRIINVGDALDAQDAVNVRTMETFVSGAIGAIGGFVTPQVWVFTGDGTTTEFSIPGATVSAASAYEAAIDGLVQTPITDFTIQISTETITFIPAPPNGAAILVRARGYSSPFVDIIWDAGGDRLINLGAGIDPTDAATFGQLTTGLAGKADVGHTHNGSDINAGFVPPQHLGSGLRDATRFLRDDGTWQNIDATLALPFTTKGDLLGFNGASAVRIPVGADGFVLKPDSGEAAGMAWLAIDADDIQSAVESLFQEVSDTVEVVPIGLGDIRASVRIGSLTSTYLAANAVTSSKIADFAVTTTKIDDAAVTADQLADNAVTTSKILDDSIVVTKIEDGAVTVAKLAASGTPDATKYHRGDDAWVVPTFSASAITSGIFARERLASGFGGIPPGDESLYFVSADGSYQIPSGGGGGGSGWSNEASQDAVGAIFLPTATITPTYNDGAPTMSWDVVAGSIGLTQVNTASLDSRYALVGSGNLPPGGTIAQFLRGTGQWASAIASEDGYQANNAAQTKSAFHSWKGVVSNDNFDDPVGVYHRKDSASIADYEVYSRASGNTYSRHAWRVGGQGVTPGGMLLDQNKATKNNRLLIGGNLTGAGGILQDVTGLFYVGISGSLEVTQTITATGAINAASFTGAIAAANISSGVISTARLGTGSPSSANYLRGDGAWVAIPSAAGITTANTATINLNLSGGNVLTGLVNDASIVNAKIADGAVSTTKIADSNVTTAKINAAAVTTVKIADENVTTAKIAALNITTALIADAAVTNGKIFNGAVTPPKLQASSGVASASTFYRGDGAWASPVSGDSMFNVKTYGAIGDGATDDTAAIEAAKSAAASLGGGIVFFPAGTYAISSTLALGGGAVSFMGAGQNTSVIRWHGSAGGTMISILGASAGIFIQGLGITGRTTARPARVIDIGAMQHCRLSDLRIEEFTAFGIRCQPDVVDRDTSWNMFSALDIDARNDGNTPGATGLYLDGGNGAPGIRNCCHNELEQIKVQVGGGGGYGLDMRDSDNNHFGMLYIFEFPTNTPSLHFGTNARANYFDHVQAVVVADGASGCWNYITWLDRENAQPAPAISGAASLSWYETGSAAYLSGRFGIHAYLTGVGAFRLNADNGTGDWKMYSPAVPAGKRLNDF